MLKDINWDNFVLDETATAFFFGSLEIDVWSLFRNPQWPSVKEELGMVDLKYDVNYILYLLGTLGADTDSVDAFLMQSILMDLDEDFVLDNFALE